MNFEFYIPTKILFGKGRLRDLHTEKLPGKKALLVITNGRSIISQKEGASSFDNAPSFIGVSASFGSRRSRPAGN